MLKAFVRLGFLFLVAASWALGQQTSALVGTWAGKAQGYGIEMKLVLNADGTADFEGVAGRWRTQGTKLLLTAVAWRPGGAVLPQARGPDSIWRIFK
jgi:hypothetical protein